MNWFLKTVMGAGWAIAIGAIGGWLTLMGDHPSRQVPRVGSESPSPTVQRVTGELTQESDAPDAWMQDPRLQAVAWVQNAAEYRALTRQCYRLAERQLLAGLQDPQWTADEAQLAADDFQSKPPAVILDLDETVLDNASYNARNIVTGQPYSTETWNQWCLEEKAGAIAGARRFLMRAQQLGVTVYFVTNRRDEVKEATINNLNRLQLGIVAEPGNVLTRNDQLGRGGDKLSRRATVAQKHRILLLIGDNLSDLGSQLDASDQSIRNQTAEEKIEALGSRWIVMPNPVYGAWERCLPEGGEMLDLKQD